MKKIFSTVAMAVVALTAVVSMTSCNSDDPSSLNAAKSVDLGTDSDKNELSYHYQGVIPNDVLALYDVTITRTAGGVEKTYTLSQYKDSKNAMTTGKDEFTVTKGTDVEVKATFKLKANYKDFVDKVLAEGGQDATIDISIFPVFNFPIPSTGKYRISSPAFLGNHTMKASIATEEKLTELGKVFEDAFSVNNK